MNSDINKIYQAMYSPILTPYNLVDNAKLDNYSYVKYYKNKDRLIAEMECIMPEEGNIVFYYCFDKKDFLQEVYENIDGEKKLVFSRGDEIEKAKQSYYGNKKSLSKAI